MKSTVFTLLIVLNFFEGDAKVLRLNQGGDEVIKLISKAGYKGEVHQVETRDGYLLKIHRLLPSSYKFGASRRPVFLLNGILTTSADFVLTGTNVALAYLLADNGYDVWLGNIRGSKYSMGHRTLSKNSKEFWNFSWHEMGVYDLPAMIDYMLMVTRASQTFFVGHSQGTTSLLVMLSSRPEYNQKIIQVHLMAPAAFLKIVSPPWSKFLNEFIKIGIPSGYYEIGHVLTNLFCYQNQKKLCRDVVLSSLYVVMINNQGRELDSVNH